MNLITDIAYPDPEIHIDYRERGLIVDWVPPLAEAF